MGLSEKIRAVATKSANDVNVPWGWRQRALKAERDLGRTTHELRQVRRMLATSQSSTMELVIKVNGMVAQTYLLRAWKVESASENLHGPGGRAVTALGDGAVYTIDVPLEIVV